ncbi:MAG: hypothetical protein ACI4SM_05745 [Candidatus Gastranaerophilaceae bacterium]
MIISEFAKYLQERNDEIIEKHSSCSLLCAWLLSILERKPKTNVEKVVHAELTLAKNKFGEFLIVAKSPSGQKLTNSLYNFALSYEQHLMRKWLQDKNSNDFNKNVDS